MANYHSTVGFFIVVVVAASVAKRTTSHKIREFSGYSTTGK